MEKIKYAGIVVMLLGLYAFVWSGETGLLWKFAIFLVGLALFFGSDLLARFVAPKRPRS